MCVLCVYSIESYDNNIFYRIDSKDMPSVVIWLILAAPCWKVLDHASCLFASICFLCMCARVVSSVNAVWL